MFLVGVCGEKARLLQWLFFLKYLWSSVRANIIHTVKTIWRSQYAIFDLLMLYPKLRFTRGGGKSLRYVRILTLYPKEIVFH